MARDPINAAGGIVIRGGARPRIAVVRRSKDDRWVLPRGKLKRDENPIAAAKREVMEETGHRVRVHEFLGTITYSARGRPKLVQFWRMLAAERPSYDLTEDITEVRWLPLSAAIRRLSFPLEKLFLRSVGRALRRRRRKPRRKSSSKSSSKSLRRAATREKAAKRPRKKQHRAAPAVTTQPDTVPHSLFRRLLGRAATVH
jgi:8-oxo-dGTP diphosphatase